MYIMPCIDYIGLPGDYIGLLARRLHISLTSYIENLRFAIGDLIKYELFAGS